MIYDLGIIMLTAGITSLLCKFLKQPVVLGYIVAGLLVGPYVCGETWLNESESVETWGQVGVIFLLFSLGLEFSFKKLVKMGSTAVIGCLTIVVGMMTAGFLLGRAMGWNEMNSLFLGSMLCMSSTTIVFKALDDLGLRQQKFAGICFGILVVEDLFAVVLMVLLASIAVKQTFDGEEMLSQVLKLVAYLLFWFVSGLSLIPLLLRKCRQHLNDETLTIVSLGLCLGMVMLAEGAGFSSALGAFVMGSILAETVEAEKIEHLVSPVKNMFGAVFFVSVGMMIDPAMLLEYWLPITLITLTVIAGQIIFATLGIVLSGQPLQVAMQSAFALTQVGEFAFIIATFGNEKGITEPYLYPVIVAVSVITTFLTPYVIKLSAPAYEHLDRILPRRLKIMLELYARQRSTSKVDSAWQRLLKKVALSLSIYVVSSVFLCTLYFSLANEWIVTLVNDFVPDGYDWVGRGVSLAVILAIVSPLLFLILNKHKRCAEVDQIMANTNLQRGGIIALNVLRLVLCAVILISCISALFDATYGVLGVLVVAIILIIFYSPKIQQQSLLLEQNFMENLSAREKNQSNGNKKAAAAARPLVAAEGVDGLHFDEVPIPEGSICIGRTLRQIDIRNSIGVNVIRITRGASSINPSATEQFCAADRVLVSGSIEDIEYFKLYVATQAG